ncbi:MAG: radical SAM protein [Planctomycetes bacterium]|nr:radical SAM protein [Planctomycetota bacterium]
MIFIDKFITFLAARRTRRYLTFDRYESDSLAAAEKEKSYLLYMHIPFCQELCPYCSFVRVKFDRCLAIKYFAALKKEIALYHEQGFRFDSIYVGGGTPTVMPEELAEVIEYARTFWEIKRLSVETNPNHLTDDILGILKAAGVNRLSVGVQSFNNEILESTDRLAKYGLGEEIAERLSSIAGMFDTLNADMVFNFANQSDEMIMQDIEILKKVCVDQVTWYPLMVSKGQKKELFEKCGEVDYRREKQLYKLIVENLGQVYKQQ